MTIDDERRSWTQTRRFEFMEWKMFWEDRLIRSDLESAFGTSTPQASVDLRKYREIADGNMVQTARGYRPSATFTPRFLRLSADRLLLQLHAFLSGVIPRADLWFRDVPPVDIAPDLARSVAPECLRPLLRALRERKAVQIHYYALTGPRWRPVAPHALAFDGHRWHIRAWCPDKEDFRDFVLSRIGEIGDSEPADFNPAEDLEWQTLVTLCLRPQAGLSADQRRAIELDYGMGEGRLDITMRASLAFYFVRRMNLDLRPSETFTPERLQLELENLDEVTGQIEAARAASKALVESRKSSRSSQASEP